MRTVVTESMKPLTSSGIGWSIRTCNAATSMPCATACSTASRTGPVVVPQQITPIAALGAPNRRVNPDSLAASATFLNRFSVIVRCEGEGMSGEPVSECSRPVAVYWPPATPGADIGETPFGLGLYRRYPALRSSADGTTRFTGLTASNAGFATACVQVASE